MSTDATPTPPAVPTPAPEGPQGPPEPVVDLIRAQRTNVGYLLTALAVVFLIGGVMMVVRSNKLAATTTDATKDGKDKDIEDMLKGASKDAPELGQASRSDYYFGAIGCAWGLIIAGSGAAYLIVGLPKPTPEGQRREARVFLLAVGGLLGAALIVMGVCFFVLWNASLMKWLDKGDVKEAKYALYPILMIVCGGLLMLAASQPARAEERNNTAVRRLVYGSSFLLTILTLFVALVIANVVVAMRVPNRLDTTSTGFYTLSDQTKQLLEGLDQPIRAYAIFQDGSDQVTDDIRRLLQSAQDANQSKFSVRFISPALNKDEVAKLKIDYPLAEMSREGVLLVAGEEGTPRARHSFIRADEFAESKEGPDGRGMAVFNGEPKLLRELMFLAENKQKPKIYFTQSSGELALGSAGGRPDARRSAAAIKGYLEKNYFDVLPLTFEVGAVAKVPDDASVVVVADPAVPLPNGGVEAIRKFVTDPRPDGKKGKLIVLAGGSARGTDEKPLKLGLEPVLTTFGVQLSDKFLYARPAERADPRDRDQGARTMAAMINPAALEARNPVALGFAGVERLPLLDCRELTVTPAPNFQVVPLLSSMPGRVTWVESTYSPSPVKTWMEFVDQVETIAQSKGDDAVKQKQVDELVGQKRISNRPRDLAVLVSEGGATPVSRVAVFGCGWFVSDDVGGQARGGATPIWFDLMGATLDWIRDKPTVRNVEEKPYTQYTIKPGFDRSRLMYVPLGIGLLIAVGLGAGVWVVRRK